MYMCFMYACVWCVPVVYMVGVVCACGVHGGCGVCLWCACACGMCVGTDITEVLTLGMNIIISMS